MADMGGDVSAADSLHRPVARRRASGRRPPPKAAPVSTYSAAASTGGNQRPLADGVAVRRRDVVGVHRQIEIQLGQQPGQADHLRQALDGIGEHGFERHGVERAVGDAVAADERIGERDFGRGDQHVFFGRAGDLQQHARAAGFPLFDERPAAEQQFVGQRRESSAGDGAVSLVKRGFQSGNRPGQSSGRCASGERLPTSLVMACSTSWRLSSTPRAASPVRIGNSRSAGALQAANSASSHVDGRRERLGQAGVGDRQPRAQAARRVERIRRFTGFPSEFHNECGRKMWYSSSDRGDSRSLAFLRHPHFRGRISASSRPSGLREPLI